MSTVLSITDRDDWGACTDNVVVADAVERTLTWVPRDLWSDRHGKRINRVFAEHGHEGLLQALVDHGIEAEHGVCIRRAATERAAERIAVEVPVDDRLELKYPLAPKRPIEEGSRTITFEPPAEQLQGERIHQWVGARYEANGHRAPFLWSHDFGRMRRQQVLVRRLLEDGFDFSELVADPELVSATGPEALEELSRVDESWSLELIEDVRGTVRDGQMVLEREPAPVASVVVLSHDSRHRIDIALGSLRAQRFDEPYEVIVVDSGSDDTADYVRSAYPEARLIRSQTRLWPGAARNRGVRAARGEFIAFLSDDCAANPEWLSRRVEMHRRGFDLVGGAVANGTPWSPVGTAGYLLEYSSLLPSERLLSAQEIPHSASYSRSVLERVGEFPEDTRTGEDTLFNGDCVGAGATVGFDAGVRITHRNLTGLRGYLRHQYVHGRGMIQCARLHGLPTSATRGSESGHASFLDTFGRYPRLRWWGALRRIAAGRRRSLPAFLALSPLIWIGLWATSVGVWSESRLQALGDTRRLPAEAPQPQGERA
jgi:glycosyltransferase involved in cell wall biosynthesis